jgi:beta-glucanase (GH16 family)
MMEIIRSVNTTGIFLVSLVSAALCVSAASAQTDWEMVWNDEFDGAIVDQAKWSFQIGDGCPNCTWGNGELQYYRAENATVQNGTLRITAREESFGGLDYTSARMRTIDKGDWKYGRFEIRARLPTGKGLWPAIWMLPTDHAYGVWAASGEIDIMEMRGRVSNVVQGTIYFGRSFPDQQNSTGLFTLPNGDFTTDFHVFALEWDPWELRWFVDDTMYQTRRDWFSENGSYPAPFDRDFHLLLNVAVGGNYDGPPDATTQFPQVMEVDYVRVFRALNADPSVILSEPTSGQSFARGSLMHLASTVSDDGTIRQVDYYQEDGLLGTVRQPPYKLDVDNLAEGCYSVYAVATDDVGRRGSSDTVAVTVGGVCPDRAPYLMSAVGIPGTVEAEYYDLGGEDVAYNDTDAGNAGGGGIRVFDNVDIDRAGSDVGFAVVRTNRTEWLEYAVNVAEAGLYDAIARVGSSSPTASFSLAFDGIGKTGRVTVPPTGGETDWSNLVVPGIGLDAGEQTMRLNFNSSGLGVSRIVFQKSSSTNLEAERPYAGLQLFDTYPNPSSMSATVTYSVPGPTEVRLSVFDMLGREITVLDAGYRSTGTYSTDFSTADLPSGVYVYCLATDLGRISKSLIVSP